MSSFRKYGGRDFSTNNNYVRALLSNYEQLNINNKSGQPNTKEIYDSHIDMSGNSILHLGCIYFQDGSVICSGNGGDTGSTNYWNTFSDSDIKNTNPGGVVSSQDSNTYLRLLGNNNNCYIETGSTSGNAVPLYFTGYNGSPTYMVYDATGSTGATGLTVYGNVTTDGLYGNSLSTNGNTAISLNNPIQPTLQTYSDFNNNTSQLNMNYVGSYSVQNTLSPAIYGSSGTQFYFRSSIIKNSPIQLNNSGIYNVFVSFPYYSKVNDGFIWYVYLTNNGIQICNLGSMVGSSSTSYLTYTGNTTIYIESGSLGIDIVFQGEMSANTTNNTISVNTHVTPSDNDWCFGMDYSTVNITRIM